MKITIRNFSDHVTPYQLQKGMDYFDRKKVSHLKTSITGRWTAEVKGRERYEVVIESRDEVIHDVSCDCIAHTEDEYCKHVIAVLLAIRETLANEPAAGRPRDPASETQELENKARALLTQKEYRASLDIIRDMIGTMPIYAEQSRWGDVESEILQRVNKGFHLLMAFVKEPIPQELRDRIYKRSTLGAVDPRYNLFDCKTHWLEILMIMSQGKELEILPLVNQQLANERNHRPEFILSRLAFMKIDLLKALGRGGEVKEVLTECPDAISLRDFFITQAVEAGDYKEAKRLAEEGRHRAWKNDHPNARHHFEKTSQALALQFNETEDIRESLLEQYRTTREMKYYRLYKETYDPKEWPAVAQKVFIKPINKKDRPGELAVLFKEEQHWPKLLKLFQDMPILGLVEKYTDVLLPRFPEEMLALYSRMVLDYAGLNKHVDAITEVCSIMKRMKTWPGGPAAVTRLKAEFKTKYATRTKLLEAIGKV